MDLNRCNFYKELATNLNFIAMLVFFVSILAIGFGILYMFIGGVFHPGLIEEIEGTTKVLEYVLYNIIALAFGLFNIDITDDEVGKNG